MRRFHRVPAIALLGAAVSGLVAAPAAAGPEPDLFDHHRFAPAGWAPGSPPGQGAPAAAEDHFPYDHFPYDQSPGQGWIPVP